MPTSNRRLNASNGFVLARSAVMGVAQLGFFHARTASAVPLPVPMRTWTRNLHDEGPEAEGSSLVVLYVTSIVLVLLGGAFAGLTIALMGQDNLNLNVLVSEGKETPTPTKVAAGKNAEKVLKLLDKGKHWVLVTLLLANVIVNETLPVILDRCLGGGVSAVVGSTVLIVIFGEILPQSICVRYGLPIGGFMSFPVLVLMWLFAPVAWPTAKLLDWVLGKHEGTTYKKSGLKTLVALHGTMGDIRERLNTDEVTIIRAVLDLKGKQVGKVMTPMQDVFTLSADTVLDEEMMEHILQEGYSRIPIYKPGQEHDFVGMLLVKILITYDPEDCMRVSDFPLAALPETRRETSCLDILNYFQVGKSHMAIVSDHPGEDHGAVGIVTLEDVIEELIGEEIIDESDVYVDIHKAIRRITPAPKIRYNARKDSGFDNAESGTNGKASESIPGAVDGRTGSMSAVSDIGIATSPKTVTFMMRRGSTGGGGGAEPGPIAVKASLNDLKQHLKHLGPSNPASNPRSHGTAAVTIKSVAAQPAGGLGIPATIGDNQDAVVYLDVEPVDPDADDEATPLLENRGGDDRPKLTGKGGVHALRKSYGSTIGSGAQHRLAHAGSIPLSQAPPAIRIDTEDAVVRQVVSESLATETNPTDQQQAAASSNPHSPARSGGRESSSLGPTQHPRNDTRSGSITESVVETGGIRKVVIMMSSSDEEEGRNADKARMAHVSEGEEEDENEHGAGSSKVGAELASPTSPPSGGGSGHGGGGGGGGGKKKSRRKKRKNKG